MVKRWGVGLALAALLSMAVPSAALAADGTTLAVGEPGAVWSAGPPQGITFQTNVVDGMTYYEPVTLEISAYGLIDSRSIVYTLDGYMRVYIGTVVDWEGFHTLVMTGTSNGVRYTKTVTFTLESPPEWWLVPVFRFYRPGTGTHFYTGSIAERDTVVTNYGSVYTFEGVSYWLDPESNEQPLYRFYRPSTGTHFYTASESEMQNVRANLSGTYTFEGPAYNVSSAPVEPPCATVYRFYNSRNGTHFYTASDAERDSVINRLSSIYSYEGPAYYLAQ